MYWIYVLWSKKLKKRYVGSTGHLLKRVKEHNQGTNKFTSGGIPWVLKSSEQYPTRREARQREHYLKSGAGRKWLDECVERDYLIGEVSEWLKEPVSKTGVGLCLPRVRISPSPHDK